MRQQFTRALPQRFAAAAGINRNLEIEQASEETGDVCFDDRNGLIEGEGDDGVRGVTANSRQVPDRQPIDLGKRPPCFSMTVCAVARRLRARA